MEHVERVLGLLDEGVFGDLMNKAKSMVGLSTKDARGIEKEVRKWEPKIRRLCSAAIDHQLRDMDHEVEKEAAIDIFSEVVDRLLKSFLIHVYAINKTGKYNPVSFKPLKTGFHSDMMNKEEYQELADIIDSAADITHEIISQVLDEVFDKVVLREKLLERITDKALRNEIKQKVLSGLHR